MSDVLFTVRESPIHGRGLFATASINPGSDILEYVGEKISKQESLARCEAGNHFIFALDDQHDIDGNVEWNPARWMNHSCSPNCAAEHVSDHIWIVATRHIHPGEELTFNYGYDLDEYRDHPCRCGAPICLGYIVAEELQEHVRRNLAHQQ
jgi:SET domain-containing protein